MTEPQLRRTLARLVARGKITEDEAVAVLQYARTPEGRVAVGLLMPDLAEQLVPLYDDLGTAAILAALAASLGRAAQFARGPFVALTRAVRASIGRGIRPAQAAIAALPADDAARLAEGILASFDREARKRAADIARYPDGVRRFHVAMRQAVRDDTAALARLGAASGMSPSQQARLIARLRTQDAYLQRFAEEIAARQAVAAAGGRGALSPEYTANRARSYAGSARAAFYEGQTGEYDRPGWIAWFEGADDPSSCTPCEEAVRGNPHLPSAVPVPGEVCYGKGLCRHRLRFEFDRAEYERLTRRAGVPVAA